MSDGNNGECFNLSSISIKQVYSIFISFSNIWLFTCKVWETSGCGMNDVFEDSKDTSGFSEHELLDIVYDTCNSSKSGIQMDRISFRQKNGAVMV